MDGHDPSGGASRTPDGAPLAGPPAPHPWKPASRPETETTPRWGAPQFVFIAVAAFLAATGAQTLAALALGLVGRAPEERTPLDILIVTLAGGAALLLVVALLGGRVLRLAPRDLGLRRPTLAEIRFAMSAALGLWLLSILANLVSIRVFGPSPQSLVLSFGAHRGPDALALDLLTGAVAAPLAEEVLYRGLIFAGLAQRLPFAAAASVSALLFALVHGIGVLVPIFVLGFGLAWVYRRTGTLWAPIVTHAVVNAVSLAILFAIPRPPA